MDDCTAYYNIVQMCDLFCLDTGFTPVQNRLLDIYKRKGVFSNTKEHFYSVLDLKNVLESAIGCSLYDLFPEISKKEIESIDKERCELVSLVENIQKNK